MLNGEVEAFARALNRKSDCYVNTLYGQVLVLRGSKAAQDLGAGAWGKIDALKRAGFTVRYFYHSQDFEAVKTAIEKGRSGSVRQKLESIYSEGN